MSPAHTMVSAVKQLHLIVIFLATLSATLPVTATEKAYQVELQIDTNQPGAIINRNIYGQFAEHLGRGIYEGIWVGENSSIPNIRGFRRDVIEALQELKVPLVRWPGGCFADEYHWRNGIGPRNKRPIKVNTNWGGVIESNAFGTHEFFELLELIGAEAYISGNLGSGSVQEMSEWLEYMTADGDSTLARLRRQNGRDKPWRVAFFGIGNESWGCGGNMRPEYYSDLYRQYATFLKTPNGVKPKLVASGGYGGNNVWTDVLSRNIQQNIDAISFHHYTLPSGNWDKKGNATGFDEQEWISTMANTLKMDGFIRDNIKILNKNDPQKKIGFYVDEWGTWYDPQPKHDPGFLYQQNTLRDAIVAALNFNIFHRYADRVHMSNIAQMVNVLQAMILTDKEKMLLTPTYHAYSLYSVFQDATSLPVKLKKFPVYRHGDISVPAISISAARGADGHLYLALVNLDPARAALVHTTVQGSDVTHATGHLLSAINMDAHNSFTAPNIVEPMAYSSPNLSLNIAPKSIVVVSLQ